MARNRTLEKADARRNALFVLPMTLFAVLLVAEKFFLLKYLERNFLEETV